MSRPAPEVTALTEPYWTALAAGRLEFQRCAECGHAWLPARAECPRCLADSPRWEPAGGAATLVSWVTYHRAYHPFFEDKLPYRVAVVELAEGPRMIAALADGTEPAIDLPLALDVVVEDGLGLAVFRSR